MHNLQHKVVQMEEEQSGIRAPLGVQIRKGTIEQGILNEFQEMKMEMHNLQHKLHKRCVQISRSDNYILSGSFVCGFYHSRKRKNMRSGLAKFYASLTRYRSASAIADSATCVSSALTLNSGNSIVASLSRSRVPAARRFSTSAAPFGRLNTFARVVERRLPAFVTAVAAVGAVSRSPVFWASPATTRKSSDVSASATGTTEDTAPAEADEDNTLESPVVSVDWLHQHLNGPNVKILDASWYMPFEGRNTLKEYQECRIPGALFFDVDGIVDPTSDLPHMLPTEAAFAAAASALGLSNEDSLIIYDGKGIFSAPRVWWMFRVFGHDKVWVLDGGLPKWRAKNYPVESSVSQDVLARIESASSSVKKIYSQEEVGPSSFKAKIREHLVWSLDQVQSNIGEKKYQHVDARSKGRFDGTAPEPRQGIRGGHVPGSVCVPFPEVLSSEGTLLGKSELADKFVGSGVSLDSPVVASCGTGVTACILALGLHRLGKKDVAVYDGSWTEWGLSPHTSVATNLPANTA
ncbi:hypothetical protein R1flu_006900 [Riccia fluitans]|uniref:Sulfurtransferase n=1 Tax=Riccia fluitans TaxID=41844 RepID=A0ABD1YXX5_9MARC